MGGCTSAERRAPAHNSQSASRGHSNDNFRFLSTVRVTSVEHTLLLASPAWCRLCVGAQVAAPMLVWSCQAAAAAASVLPVVRLSGVEQHLGCRDGASICVERMTTAKPSASGTDISLYALETARS